MEAADRIMIPVEEMMNDRCNQAGFCIRVLGCLAVMFLMTLGPLAAAAPFGAEVVDRIVAVVNDDIITLSDLNRALKPFKDRFQSLGYEDSNQAQLSDKLQREVLDRLIEQKLTDQQIKRTHLEVGEEEIDSALRNIKENNLYSDEDLQKALAVEGMTLEEFRTNLKEQILRSRLVNREVKAKIVITEQEIKSYYEAHAEEYGRELKYHLRNIIMRLPRGATDSEKRGVRPKMEEVLEKLKNGEPFEVLARQYSESDLAVSGGDLGQFKLQILSQQLQEALKGLGEGAYTPILETDQGYQIFFVQEITATPGRPLTEVSEAIHEKLYAQVVEDRFKEWLQELRRSSHIQVIE